MQIFSYNIAIFPYVNPFEEGTKTPQWFCLIETADDIISPNATKSLNASSLPFQLFLNEGFKPLYKYQYNQFFDSFGIPTIFDGTYVSIEDFQHYIREYDTIDAMQSARRSIRLSTLSENHQYESSKKQIMDEVVSTYDPEPTTSQQFFVSHFPIVPGQELSEWIEGHSSIRADEGAPIMIYNEEFNIDNEDE